MSFTKKILDSARESLNSLMEKVSADGGPLSGVDPDALQVELEQRHALNQGATARKGDNPRARHAGGSQKDAEQREKIAAERERRIRGAREAKAREQRKAQDEAFRRVKEQARRQASSGGPRPGSSSSGSRGPGFGGLGGLGRDPAVVKAYKTLDLPYGASWDDVKTSYRKLMRKYHPDLHNQSPKKQKAATELTMQVTQAYNELDRHLNGK